MTWRRGILIVGCLTVFIFYNFYVFLDNTVPDQEQLDSEHILSLYPQQIFSPTGQFLFENYTQFIREDRYLSKIQRYRRAVNVLFFAAPSVSANYSQSLQSSCSNLTQREQSDSPECRALWEFRMATEPIVKIDRFWGYERKHFGMMFVTLSSGLKAIYKPCDSPSQSQTGDGEIVGSFLNFLLGWSLVSPAVHREISPLVLEDVCRKLDNDSPKQRKCLDNLDQTIFKCKTKGDFKGVMIGWWNSLELTSSTRKTNLPMDTIEWIRDFQRNSSNFYFTAYEESKTHSLLYLLNDLSSPGTNEFRLKNEMMVVTDVDRANFDIFFRPSDMNLTTCYVCHVAEEVHKTLQEVGPRSPGINRLSVLVKLFLNGERRYQPKMFYRLEYMVDQRIKALYECVEQCLSKYGKDAIIPFKKVVYPTPAPIKDWDAIYRELDNS